MTDTYKIDLPFTFRDRLKAKATELSVPVAKLVEQTMELLLTGEVTPIIRPREVTLEDAGTVFLAHMEESQASLIRELCKEHERRPHEYVLSYIYLAFERGETATMVSETVLERHGIRAEDSVAGLRCEFCGTGLVNPRRGQRFCPDPEDGEGCGRKHSLAELHKRRAARTGKPDNRNAPPQVDVKVYSRAAQSVA